MAATVWWRCPKCRELNPPLIEYCTNSRCRAKKPTDDNEPKPEPQEPKPQKPKEPKPAWLIKLGVWLTVLTPAVAVVLWFLPPPWSTIVNAVWQIIKQLVGG